MVFIRGPLLHCWIQEFMVFSCSRQEVSRWSECPWELNALNHLWGHFIGQFH